MDTQEQIKCLNEVLRLQHRSVLMYSVTAGGVVGLEYQAHAEKLTEHALYREALQAAIEPTGREAASEAVEHRLEHLIMRKQEQVDYLLRARRRP